MKVLNIVVTLKPDGSMYEADPRHAELLVEFLSLQNSHAVGTRRSKDEIH